MTKITLKLTLVYEESKMFYPIDRCIKLRQLIMLALLFISNFGFCQLQSVIVDAETQEGIPYVNIWVEDENTGTTSNEDGLFKLELDTVKIIVFSAIGYETKKINSDSIGNTLALDPMISELGEVVVTAGKRMKLDQELVIGEFKKSKIRFYLSCGTRPWMWARFFEYKKEYQKTNFIREIKLLTDSDVKDSKFNVRLYRKNDNGEPEGYIYEGNIFGLAKKGRKNTIVDLSELNIEFPKEGLFVVIEWLIIEQNKHEYKFTWEGSKQKHDGVSYEPSFGALPSDININSWFYINGRWRKAWVNKSSWSKMYDKYALMAIEMTLSN